MPLDDEVLREAASHRGLKLVKSRKRKPGSGDYGMFGLYDGGGKALFGVGDDGFTASAHDIADYLRKDEASSWSASAQTASAGPSKARDSRRSDGGDDEAPSAIRPRPPRGARGTPVRAAPSAPETEGTEPNKSEQSDRPRRTPERSRAPIKVPPPLAVRAAIKADTAAIAGLLGKASPSETAIRKRIAQAHRLSEPLMVASRGPVVGFIEWHIIPSLAGDIARITTILVDPDARRQGIGRKLVQAVQTRLNELNLKTIEIMSDISLRNNNGFLRAVGFEQASYRFVGRS